MNTEIEIANVEQAEAWDGHEGDLWTDNAERYERSTRRQRQRLLDAGLIAAGDSVLDIGCGPGQGTREAARLAAPGSVLGVDLSSRMVAYARDRSEAEGLVNLTFVQGDAQVFPFEPERHDVVVSFYCAMFFGDPIAAFSNIRNGMRSGGRLGLLVWRELDRNEWLKALRHALALGRELPVPPPDAPSPFGLARQEHVHNVLGAAGFDDIELQSVDELVEIGTNVDEAYAFTQTMGIVEGLTGGMDADDRERALANVRDVLASHATSEGVLLPSSSWLITARRT